MIRYFHLYPNAYQFSYWLDTLRWTNLPKKGPAQWPKRHSALGSSPVRPNTHLRSHKSSQGCALPIAQVQSWSTWNEIINSQWMVMLHLSSTWLYNFGAPRLSKYPERMRNLTELCGKTCKIRIFRATGRLEILGGSANFWTNWNWGYNSSSNLGKLHLWAVQIYNMIWLLRIYIWKGPNLCTNRRMIMTSLLLGMQGCPFYLHI